MLKETEEWKDIPGYEGLYKASSLGRVMSMGRKREQWIKGNRNPNPHLIIRYYPEKVLKPSKTGSRTKGRGDYNIELSDGNGIKKIWILSRLIATTFIPNPKNKEQVNHKDHNTANCKVSNLEWLTRDENILYSLEKGILTHSTIKKTVYQYSLTGEFINTYESCLAAAKSIGIRNPSNVARCAKNELKTSQGYVWSYIPITGYNPLRQEKAKDNSDFEEQWKDVINYEGLYMVSNKGRIKSLPRLAQTSKGYRTVPERFLKLSFAKAYQIGTLCKQSSRDRKFLVNRLVARHFIANPKNKEQVNHIDGNPLNNLYTNLEWCSGSENVRHFHSINTSDFVKYSYAFKESFKGQAV